MRTYKGDVTTDEAQDGTEYCTEFTEDHGIDEEELDEEELDVFRFAFVCPNCGGENPLKGDPLGFAYKPFACLDCGWVSLLWGESIEEFADEHYDDTETTGVEQEGQR